MPVEVEGKIRYARRNVIDDQGLRQIKHGSRAHGLDEIFGDGPEADGGVTELFGKYFNPDGTWFSDTIDLTAIDLDTASHGEILAVLNTRLEEFYLLVQHSLDYGHEFAFNRHDVDHVRRVTDFAINLLTGMGASEEQLKECVLVGMLHDVGNLVSRGAHPWVVDMMIDHLVPELQSNPSLRRRVLRGIGLHDERIAQRIFDKTRESFDRHPQMFPRAENAYSAIRQVYGEVALAVLIGDKLDATNRDRVTLRRFPNDSMPITEADMHYLVAALINDSSNFCYAEEGGKGVFRHTLHFQGGVDADEICTGTLCRHTVDGARRVHVPQSLHDLHRHDGIPHMLTWVAANFQLNGGRLSVLMDALRASMGIDEYIMQIQDKEVGADLHISFDLTDYASCRNLITSLGMKSNPFQITTDQDITQRKYLMPDLIQVLRATAVDMLTQNAVNDSHIEIRLGDSIVFRMEASSRDQLIRDMTKLFVPKLFRGVSF